MRTNLELKHHGVPARGIQGLDGEVGPKGISVYIGFINDFFDYEEYDIDPAVRYTKRKTDILNYTEAWVNYKNQYNNMNVNSMYYTGEFTNVKTAAKDEYDNNIEQPLDVVNYNLNLPGTSLTAEHINVDQIEQYEFQFVQDITYTTAANKQLSYVDIYDFEDPQDNIDERLLATYDPVPAYTVHIDINHITYDYSDLKRIALMKFNALNKKYPEKYPYNMWDFYTTFDDSGEQIKGKQSAATYKTWLDDPDKYPLFIREELEGKHKEYITGVTAYSASVYTGFDAYNNPYTNYKIWPLENTAERHYLIMPKDNNPAIDDLTYALTYFKYPVKTFPLYSYGSTERDEEQMIDYEGYTYIGINDNSMYQIDDTGAITLRNLNDILIDVRKSNEDTPLIDLTNFTLSDQAPFINTIRDYKVILQNNTSLELIPTNDLVVWHSGNGKLKLPTTLASTINVGDIVYFYTNKGQFDNIKNTDTQNTIEYMAIITEDMVGCTVLELIDKALIIKPFNYSVFNEEYSEDRAKINRSTVITNIYRTIPDDYDLQGYEHFNIKSAEEILTLNDGGCALRLISSNYKNDKDTPELGLLKIIAKNNNTFDTNNLSSLNIYSLKNESNKLINNHIQPDNNNLIIKNFAVNNTNHKYLNFELTDIVYDKHIKFTNGYFIYDLLNVGNINYEFISVNNNITYNFSYTLNKADIISDMNYAADYKIGYIIMHNNKIILQEETYNDSITFNQKISNSLNTIQTDDNGNPQQIIYDIIFTVVKTTGMKYYSNLSQLILTINSETYKNKNQLIIDVYDVLTQYPYIINDNGEIIEGEENIIFNMPEITAEDYTGIVNSPVEFSISPKNEDITINSITFNGLPIINKSISNSWITITSTGDNHFQLAINDNLPDINISGVQNIKTYKIDDYMLSYCSPNNSIVAPLFTYLNKYKKYQVGSSERQIKVVVTYYKKDNDTLYKQLYIIKLPGFSDPRVLPEFTVKLTNDYNLLEQINTVDNGVLCNQFRTYIDISVPDNIIDGWTRYNNVTNDNVTVDFTIKHLNATDDIENHPTVRLALYSYTSNLQSHAAKTTKQSKSNISGDDIILLIKRNLANYYKIDYYPIDSQYIKYYNVNLSVYTSYKLNDNNAVTSIKIKDSNYNILNHKIFPTCKDKLDNILIKNLYHDTYINFKDVPLSLLKEDNPLRIAVDFEFANPIISQLFYKFNIQDIKIHYKIENKDYVFCDTNSFKSESLKIDINPLSLIANYYPRTVFNISTNNVIITSTTDVTLNACTKVYNNTAYNNNPVLENTLLKNKKSFSKILYPTKDIYNDDVKNIKITAITPKSALSKLKELPSYYKNDDGSLIIVDADLLSSESKITDLNNKAYLSVFYNADVFHPRFRDDKETFYFNNSENSELLEANRYRQRYINNNTKTLNPILFNIESSLTIRNEQEFNSIDIWNYEYQIKQETEPEKYEIPEPLIKGKKSLWSNAWILLYNKLLKDNQNALDDNPYKDENILSLNDLYNALEQKIPNESLIDLSHNMVLKDIYPENNKLYRILTWEIKWEYVYEYDNSIQHALMVTPFDCLMKYLILDNRNFNYADTLDQLSLYLNHWENISALSGNNIIPYNLCYDLSERFGYDTKTNIIHYHMLRKPCVSDDVDNLNKTLIGYNDYKNYLKLDQKDLSDTAGEYNINAYK